MYNKTKNNKKYIYLYKINIKIIGYKYNKLDYNMQIVYYIEKKTNICRDNLIDKRIF